MRAVDFMQRELEGSARHKWDEERCEKHHVQGFHRATAIYS